MTALVHDEESRRQIIISNPETGCLRISEVIPKTTDVGKKNSRHEKKRRHF